jgi:methionyl-tRNA synthetase
MTDTTVTPPVATPEPVVSNVIEYADFEKVELRAGTIRSAEAVPKSELLKLDVSFGEHGNRTILARIATSYTPEAVTGRQIVCVLNLAPRKMKGIESHGMLLASKRSDGVLALVSLSGVVPDGAEVG